MLKKIRVDQLTLGMHLKEFCGSWMEHPFWRTGFVIVDPKDIDAGSWDLCGSHTLKLSKSIFSCQDVGNNSVTLIVTDAAGSSVERAT